VDLVETLDVLGSRGAHVVRVDSGGVLLGALLDLGLVDELALLVHPIVVGTGRRWSDGHRLDLKPAGTEVFEGGVVWLRYCL
jgi:2,5-diamino-6-(ribosylamino)-4(3H)-pyrimidinone 5'-phosphate reductase